MSEVEMSGTDPRTVIDRRTLLRGALGVSAAIGLAGCATSGSGGSAASTAAGGSASPTGAADAANPLGVTTDAPVEVVIFDGGYGHDYAQQDALLYSGRYSAAKVTVTPTQQIQQTLQPRFAGGTPPDVVDNSGANLMDFGALSSAGQLADLQALLDAPSWDVPGKKVSETLYPGVVEAGTLNKKVEILNYVYTVYGFWYSQTMFAKQGWEAPTTWDAFMALSKKIAAAGMSPFTYQGKYPYYIYEPILTMATKAGGMGIVTSIDNLEPNAWTAREVVAAAESIHEIVAKGYLLKGSQGLSHTESQTAWCQGKAAFIPCGSWLSNEMKAITPKGFDMAVVPTPSLGTGDKLPVTALHASPGEGFVVAAQGRNRQGGLEFLRAMLSAKASLEFTKANAALTVVKGTADTVRAGTAPLVQRRRQGGGREHRQLVLRELVRADGQEGRGRDGGPDELRRRREGLGGPVPEGGRRHREGLEGHQVRPDDLSRCTTTATAWPSASSPRRWRSTSCSSCRRTCRPSTSP